MNISSAPEQSWPCRMFKDGAVGVRGLDGDIVLITHERHSHTDEVWLTHEDAYAFANAIAAVCGREQIADNGPCWKCRMLAERDARIAELEAAQ